MDIMAGLGALKAATDLTRSLRDRAKSGEVKPDEIAGRIGEIYDYIVDSKDSLVDAKDTIAALREENRRLKEKLHQKASVSYHEGAIWQKLESGAEDGPFCPSCWTDELLHRGTISYVEGGFVRIHCGRHKPPYYYDVPEQAIKNVDLKPHKQLNYSNLPDRNYY